MGNRRELEYTAFLARTIKAHSDNIEFIIEFIPEWIEGIKEVGLSELYEIVKDNPRNLKSMACNLKASPDKTHVQCGQLLQLALEETLLDK
jgi:hypothetical protein